MKAHDFAYTEQVLLENFGPRWRDKLTLANVSEPVGSGCIAQVYKGEYHKRKGEKTPLRIDEHGQLKLVEKVHDSSRKVKQSSSDSSDSFKSCPSPTPTPSVATNPSSSRTVAIKIRHPRVESLIRSDLELLHFAIGSLEWAVPRIR